jgi:hypothetical protein
MVANCGCQFATDKMSERVTDQIAQSHVEANVPKGKLFGEYLQRDLQTYFCGGAKDCRVEYILLRDGPTQAGVSYPKYYLWCKSYKGKTLNSEGAVRVAAVEQGRFDVTDVIFREQILETPSIVTSIFPAALADKIAQYARDGTPGTRIR